MNKMKVFKFGGASVQNAGAIKNVANILQNFGQGQLVIVVSAMGKTTNALEDVLNAFWEDKDHHNSIQQVKDYHFNIINGLFPEEKLADVKDEIDNYFIALEHYFEKEPERNYDYIYDQVVCYGELISSRILSLYLNSIGFRNKWIDARNFVITDDLYREARIDWKTTTNLIRSKIPQMLENAPVITQGFIGSSKDNVTTTLGREGSDFTASIFAYALDAEEVVIWKDVPGILNADPRKFPNTVKFDKLSYQEAIEMTYYGASVLHPKTIKPIQNKNIPMNVRSFIHPEAAGTIVTSDCPVMDDVPIIILKEKQQLVSLSTKDFSFIAEENIRTIFEAVVTHGISVNVMNNTAISFLICIDEMEQKVDSFEVALQEEFIINNTKNLQLLTIKHYREDMLGELLYNKEIILEQRSGNTVQFVIRQKDASLAF
jgi:aspartate kinase